MITLDYDTLRLKCRPLARKDFSVFAENIESAHMVYMFMRYKDCAYIFRCGTDRTERRAYCATADTCIYQKLSAAVAHECAVSA